MLDNTVPMSDIFKPNITAKRYTPTLVQADIKTLPKSKPLH